MESNTNKKPSGTNSTFPNIILLIIIVLAYVLFRKLLHGFFPQNATAIALAFIIVILIIGNLVVKLKR